jgi:hypothetical protein
MAWGVRPKAKKYTPTVSDAGSGFFIAMNALILKDEYFNIEHDRFCLLSFIFFKQD